MTWGGTWSPLDNPGCMELVLGGPWDNLVHRSLLGGSMQSTIRKRQDDLTWDVMALLQRGLVGSRGYAKV